MLLFMGKADHRVLRHLSTGRKLAMHRSRRVLMLTLYMMASTSPSRSASFGVKEISPSWPLNRRIWWMANDRLYEFGRSMSSSADLVMVSSTLTPPSSFTFGGSWPRGGTTGRTAPVGAPSAAGEVSMLERAVDGFHEASRSPMEALRSWSRHGVEDLSVSGVAALSGPGWGLELLLRKMGSELRSNAGKRDLPPNMPDRPLLERLEDRLDRRVLPVPPCEPILMDNSLHWRSPYRYSVSRSSHPCWCLPAGRFRSMMQSMTIWWKSSSV
mmetsp:Transcript_129678/g.224122  ORF Transcript_129678/g.224122 Transcript_129678/m.224122 type:complete len:270 (-) Transcript_129678:955-1764(-)